MAGQVRGAATDVGTLHACSPSSYRKEKLGMGTLSTREHTCFGFAGSTTNAREGFSVSLPFPGIFDL